ncbi:putative transcription factor B3-Domain family [Helianthus anomalus]
MVPINSSTSLQSYSKNTIGFHIIMNLFSGSTYIDGFTFFTVFIYIYSSLNPFLKFTYRFTICKLYFIWLKVHQDDAVCKLWGVYKGPTNVLIHTEDGRLFNVGLSAYKGKIFFFHGWSNVVEHLRLTKGCLVVFNPIDSTTFKLTYFVDGVSRGSFWTYPLPPSSPFYVRLVIFIFFILY